MRVGEADGEGDLLDRYLWIGEKFERSVLLEAIEKPLKRDRTFSEAAAQRPLAHAELARDSRDGKVVAELWPQHAFHGFNDLRRFPRAGAVEGEELEELPMAEWIGCFQGLPIPGGIEDEGVFQPAKADF